jgi:type I restriction enzyme S subunit
MSHNYTFKQIVIQKGGFLRGPFGGDLKKEIFVEKSGTTYKVYEQGVVLNSDKNIGRYYISEEDYKAKLHKFSVQDKDFLVSCSGVNMGAIYQLKVPFERGIINQALLRIRLNVDIIDDNYFKYLFKELISRKITSGSGDSTIPNFPGLDLIKNVEFELPTKYIQIKIGQLLYDLDSKIELNNRINAELEAMAKTLYDYWFVQFDFPNIEGRPYKSSGGKMVWNEELKRQIPEMWKVVNLFKEMDVQYGFPFSTEKFSDVVTNTPVIRIRDILENTISTYTTELVDEKYMLIQNDLIIGMDGNFHLNFWDKTGSYLNQRSVRIRSRKNSEVSNFQTYFELFPYIKAREKNVSRTTVGHLSDRDLKGLFLISPKKEDKFNPKLTFDVLLKKIISNRIQNQQLSSLRDWLLPMLMNGQVKVSDVEE